MSKPVILRPIPSVISSQASEGGYGRCNLRPIPSPDQCGPLLSPANRSVRPASAKERKTSVISGLSSENLSPSACLQSFSVNKSVQRMVAPGCQTCGSTSKPSSTGPRSMKICSKCGEQKPRAEFRKYSGRSADGLRGCCRACLRKSEKKWRDQNKKRLATARANRVEKEKVYREEYDAIHRGRLLIGECRRRAKRKGLPFNLDQYEEEIEARIQMGRCEMTGIPFDFHASKPSWNSPSIHRRIPEKGYVYPNVRVICYGMNAAMWDWGEEKLQEVLNMWQKKQAQQKRTVSLQQCLEKRLKRRLSASGSLEYTLTWKNWDMSSGPQICALRARGRKATRSVTVGSGKTKKKLKQKCVGMRLLHALSEHRTSGNGCTGVLVGQPTSSTRDYKGGYQGGRIRNGKVSTDTLDVASQLVGWQTPKLPSGGTQTERTTPGGGLRKMEDQVALIAGWPTPTKGNADGSQMAKDASATGRRPDGSKATVSLNQVAKTLAGWGTPTSTERSGQGDRNVSLMQQAKGILSGWGTPTVVDETGRGYAYPAGNRDKPILTLVGQARAAEPGAELIIGRASLVSRAQMGKRGGSPSLNPFFSAWLQGYYPAWINCAPKKASRSRKASKGGRPSSGE